MSSDSIIHQCKDNVKITVSFHGKKKGLSEKNTKPLRTRRRNRPNRLTNFQYQFQAVVHFFKYGFGQHGYLSYQIRFVNSRQLGKIKR
jgi:hypothetical protein